MLTISNLSKRYGNKQVLRELSASFAEGRVHGIIGLNGAGKTTLFQCISGLLEYTGSVQYSKPGPLKNQIGYVPAEPYFFPRITGGEYLAFLAHAKGIKGAELPGSDTFELPLREYIEHYSTGMKRKLAIQGAMIGAADLYILDEPFNGVDIKSNLLIKQRMEELRAQGKTVLFSSHIISSLTEVCDEIHLLKDGRIARHYLPADYPAVESDLMAL
ncbi:MAG: ATP-binding cassette domain-containing protein [Flavipsychrobacter sp.]|nr:ATP-binding cassette domain-containing protein [Flavipsychrobacter sp.]